MYLVVVQGADALDDWNLSSLSEDSSVAPSPRSFDHRMQSGFEGAGALRILSQPPEDRSAFEIPLAQEELNIDNLGSIDAMVNFVLPREAE